jgi:hypothetical protein
MNLLLSLVVIATSNGVFAQSMETVLEIEGKDSFYVERPVSGKGYIRIDSIGKPYPTYDVLKFIASNFKMPATWKMQGVQKNMVVSFAIDKGGEISDPIVHSSTPALVDVEMKRVFTLLPPWVPAKKGIVLYDQTSHLTIPVTY